MSDYMPTAEVATHVRAALKEAFPGVRFSVRSRTYSGGSSIDVRWTDGPTTNNVDAAVGKFAGSGFDGMTDMKYSLNTTIEGRRVLCDFVQCHRDVSDEWRAELIAELERVSGHTIATDPFDYGQRVPVHVDREGETHRMVETETEYVNTLLHRMTAQRER